MDIIDYCILEGRTTLDLERRVKSYMKEGFIPLGGVSVSVSYNPNSSNLTVFVQAMVKNKKGN